MLCAFYVAQAALLRPNRRQTSVGPPEEVSPPLLSADNPISAGRCFKTDRRFDRPVLSVPQEYIEDTRDRALRKIDCEGVAATILAGGMVRPGDAIAVAGAAVKRTGRERQAAVLGLIQSCVGKGAAAQYRYVREVEIDGVSSTGRIIVVDSHCSFVSPLTQVEPQLLAGLMVKKFTGVVGAPLKVRVSTKLVWLRL